MRPGPLSQPVQWLSMPLIILETLKRRPDFLKAQGGARAGSKGLVLQWLAPEASPSSGPSNPDHVAKDDVRPTGAPAAEVAPPDHPEPSRKMTETDPCLIRVGFTATRKVGSAVVRNRAKRRLRALAREILPLSGRPGSVYVLIARSETATRPYDRLRADLRSALARVHDPRAGSGRKQGARNPDRTSSRTARGGGGKGGTRTAGG